MKRLTLLLLCLALGMGSAWATVGTTNPNQFIDSVDWCQFGCGFGQYATPQAWVSAGGNTGLVGNTSGQDWFNLQQDNSWAGNFPSLMGLVYNGAFFGNAPTTIGVFLNQPVNSIGAFPTRYWTKGRLEGWEQLSGDAMVETYKVGNTTCPPCVIACGHVCRVPDGELAGLEIDGPEYETIWAFAGLCEIVDFPFVMLCNDICDRQGIDTMSAGSLCGLAIEASRRGLIDEQLDYGDAKGVERFLRRMARREGKAADLFAEGILAVEKELGLEGVAVHVKGMDPAAYDPRRTTGMGLGYVTSTRGACHMRSTFIRAELVGLCELGALEGKGELYVAWENRLVMMDTMIFCRFYRDMLEWPFLTRIVNAAIGTDYTAEELDAIANRIVTETHRFNELRGFGPESEKLPAWITERPLETANGELRFTDDDLAVMVGDYYEARGWGQPPV